MTTEKLRELHAARPFRPFDRYLADGHRVRVDHPEVLAYRQNQRTAFVVLPDGSVEHIDLLLVSSLSVPAEGNGSRRRRRRG